MKHNASIACESTYTTVSLCLMQVAHNLEFDFHVVYPNVRYSRFVRYSHILAVVLCMLASKTGFPFLIFFRISEQKFRTGFEAVDRPFGLTNVGVHG